MRCLSYAHCCCHFGCRLSSSTILSILPYNILRSAVLSIALYSLHCPYWLTRNVLSMSEKSNRHPCNGIALLKFFIFNADSRAEGVEFPTLYASRLSDIFFNASFCRFGRFRFGCFKKGREWVEQGFSKKKYYPQGWRFFLKTIEHPNPGFTFAPRTGTIHLMRLPERPSKWR